MGLVSVDVQHVRQQTAAIDHTDFTTAVCVAFMAASSMADRHTLWSQRFSPSSSLHGVASRLRAQQELVDRFGRSCRIDP
jgi:hypothetical protein